jgi:dolichol-phosphate mannosyltransferase
MIVPPPKYHVERLVPGVEVAPEARLKGMVVIQRGGEGAVSLDEAEALETLMRNCEDAYGFPPYAAIEGSLRRRNGADLKDVERGIVASALSGLPAAVIRSETMDWSCRVPGVVSQWTPSAPPKGVNSQAPRILAGRNGRGADGPGPGA